MAGIPQLLEYHFDKYDSTENPIEKIPAFNGTARSVIADLRERCQLMPARDEKCLLWVVPSILDGHKIGDESVSRSVSEPETRDIIAALGLTDHTLLSVGSVTTGGASVASGLAALSLHVRNGDFDRTMLVGAEYLSGFKQKDLIEAAGRSVCPAEECKGATLNSTVDMSLITAYALMESAILREIECLTRTGQTADQIHPLIQRMRELRNRKDAHVYSGEITRGEVAKSCNGAMLAVVGIGESTNQPDIYIPTGAVEPGKPTPWYLMPESLNMAYSPVNGIVRHAGLTDELPKILSDNTDTAVELYGSFFVAKLAQVAALLGHPRITMKNIESILDFISRYKSRAPLTEWASWGISSAKKLDCLVRETRDELKHFLLIGSGGAMDSIAATFFTTDRERAEELCVDGSYQITAQNELDGVGELVTDPGVLNGKRGSIGMIAFQHPVKSKPVGGPNRKEGTTFVQVRCPDGSVILTNLVTASDGTIDGSGIVAVLTKK